MLEQKIEELTSACAALQAALQALTDLILAAKNAGTSSASVSPPSAPAPAAAPSTDARARPPRRPRENAAEAPASATAPTAPTAPLGRPVDGQMAPDAPLVPPVTYQKLSEGILSLARTHGFASAVDFLTSFGNTLRGRPFKKADEIPESQYGAALAEVERRAAQPPLTA